MNIKYLLVAVVMACSSLYSADAPSKLRSVVDLSQTAVSLSKMTTFQDPDHFELTLEKLVHLAETAGKESPALRGEVIRCLRDFVLRNRHASAEHVVSVTGRLRELYEDESRQHIQLAILDCIARFASEFPDRIDEATKKWVVFNGIKLAPLLGEQWAANLFFQAMGTIVESEIFTTEERSTLFERACSDVIPVAHLFVAEHCLIFAGKLLHAPFDVVFAREKVLTLFALHRESRFKFEPSLQEELVGCLANLFTVRDGDGSFICTDFFDYRMYLYITKDDRLPAARRPDVEELLEVCGRKRLKGEYERWLRRQAATRFGLAAADVCKNKARAEGKRWVTM